MSFLSTRNTLITRDPNALALNTGFATPLCTSAGRHHSRRIWYSLSSCHIWNHVTVTSSAVTIIGSRGGGLVSQRLFFAIFCNFAKTDPKTWFSMPQLKLPIEAPSNTSGFHLLINSFFIISWTRDSVKDNMYFSFGWVFFWYWEYRGMEESSLEMLSNFQKVRRASYFIHQDRKCLRCIIVVSKIWSTCRNAMFHCDS